jgi:hypothetical protein
MRNAVEISLGGSPAGASKILIVSDVPPAYLDQDLDGDLANVRIPALAFQ